ncbi:unnamed protein product, partial [Amoebophrya sp. A25]
ISPPQYGNRLSWWNRGNRAIMFADVVLLFYLPPAQTKARDSTAADYAEEGQQRRAGAVANEASPKPLGAYFLRVRDDDTSAFFQSGEIAQGILREKASFFLACQSAGDVEYPISTSDAAFLDIDRNTEGNSMARNPAHYQSMVRISFASPPEIVPLWTRAAFLLVFRLRGVNTFTGETENYIAFR